ncbi:MAG: hypothetical protein J5I98_21045 [Phaeodactylibacter sp.]|nr:hypothetical protein [Phaeodactylibacter sp.]
MTKEELKISIRKELEEGSVEKALTSLIMYAQKSAPGQLEDATSLRASFLNAKRQYELKGVITKPEYDLAFSKAVNGIQAILGGEHSESAAFQSTRKKSRTLLYIMAAVVAIAIASSGYFLWPQSKEGLPADSVVEMKDTSEKTAARIPEGAKEEEKKNPVITQPATGRPPAPVAENQPKANNPPVKEKPSIKTFIVKVLVNADCADSEIYVDGKPADVVESTSLVKTIRVAQKDKAHVFEIRDGNQRPVTKLIHSDGQRVAIPCN